MNRLILLITFLIFPFLGFCDTIDYWHIYYNDSIIARFNLTSTNLQIQLDRSQIRHQDIITIRYGDDTPCSNCSFVLFVRDEKKRKLRITSTNEHFGKLSFNLKDLIAFGDKNKSQRYDFYYWERETKRDNNPMELVLQIKIREN